MVYILLRNDRASAGGNNGDTIFARLITWFPGQDNSSCTPPSTQEAK